MRIILWHVSRYRWLRRVSRQEVGADVLIISLLFLEDHLVETGRQHLDQAKVLTSSACCFAAILARPVALGRLVGAGRGGPVGSRSVEHVREQPVCELRLKPRRLRRHQLAGIGDGHQLLHPRRVQRERDRGTPLEHLNAAAALKEHLEHRLNA